MRSRCLTRTFLVLLPGLLLALSRPPARADEADKPVVPPEFKGVKFRLVGPSAGGRVCRAAGVPGDPHIYYAATAGGGVWKSTNGGILWKPIFEDQPDASIGSIAVAPSDPNVIYVGAGEANIRGNVQVGHGIYKSTDAGKTWTHVWTKEGQIGTMIVHPANPDVAFAAVLGHAFGPNPDRGVYRTTDGGKTWIKVLGKDENTGASDVCFDPSNPRILFAGLWQARRRPWELTSGGPGSGLYVSHDGGDHWKQLKSHGLPEGVWGKVGVAVAPSDGRRVYALIEAEKGGLYRSDDGGEKWKLVNGGHYLTQRAWYYMTLTIDPTNPDVIWVPQVRLVKSIDGGATFKRIKSPHHGDHHDIWIDPKDPKRIIDSNDGGVDVTVNGGINWYAPRLPISQFYHVAADAEIPYHLSGTMQDLGTASGPSNSLNGGGITFGDWTAVGGGETGFTAPDPSNPNIIYAGEYGGYISRYDKKTGQARNVSVYPYNPSGHGAGELKYRFQWTAPIMISPHDPKVLYHAANVLFRSTDGGQHWTKVSPDLTRNDPAKEKWSGGPITGDNTGAEYYCTIFAIAESPKEKGVLWAGSDDGLVHVSRDNGRHWVNVTRHIPGMPEWGRVDCIEPSPTEGGTAYLVVDNHMNDDLRPYLFKTTDYGQSWKSLAAGLPSGEYLRAVREDPKRPGLLFAGSNLGVYFSRDGGAKWQPLKLNLPAAEITDLKVKDNDLVVSTDGRSLWILDDLTPLRDNAWRTAEGPVYFFRVEPAIRWRYREPVYGMKDIYAVENPPVGAALYYYLKAKPKEPITLEITDVQGRLVTTLSSKKIEPEVPEEDPDAPSHPYKKPVLTTEVGINRVVWDLRYAGAERITGAKIDAGEPAAGPLALPGTYTLKLTVAGTSMTRRVDVSADPRTNFKYDDLAAQLKLSLAVRDDITRLAVMVKQIRSLRGQLQSRQALLAGHPKAADLVKMEKALLEKLDALETRLHNPRAIVTYDILAQKGGARLYSQFGFLFEATKDSDGAPTQGVMDMYAEDQKELRKDEAEFKELITKDLAAINDLARRLDLGGVMVPGPKK